MEGPYLILWRRRLGLLGNPCAGVSLDRFNGRAFSVSLSAARGPRGRAAARSARLVCRQSLVRPLPPAPARTLSCARRNTRHTSPRLRSRHHGENTKPFAFAARLLEIETRGTTGGSACIGGDNIPITFKRASLAMPRRWAVLHGSQADESESLPRRRGRGWQHLPHPPIRARELRRQVHPDARDEGLQEGAHVLVAGRVGGAQDRHDDLGHYGPERLPRAAQGSVLLRSARHPRGVRRHPEEDPRGP